MSKQLFNELKADILKEFSIVEEVLKTGQFVSTSNDEVSIQIEAEEFFSKNNKEIIKLLKPKCSQFKNDIIYKIELCNIIDKSNFMESFQLAKDNKVENRAFCKFNSENLDHIKSDVKNTLVLYIGSSKAKSVITRMRQHLGFAGKTTYAMHLKSWLPKAIKCSIKITFLELAYNNKIKVKTNILELVEQTLWYREKPLLGKKSGLM
ncbi:hypothetical protein [Polaribacter dokdonensis]|uniref:GIY-YIG domain-containing protein n=1 Tax=Polaribacter dokdonensis DSW-5 TaxID=1300348 RepID=A0A0M9CGX7_9FLAO|nr:hypothetical protein [Polaribacter dokdonensis]KOY51939.1 hypothetical protein I602_1499 [Polaribacter dokdonensis DSW-5]SED99426.1 hypothetical protein SAMN05444353_0268 [Polaribacter dokdonensis DSW-5]